VDEHSILTIVIFIAGSILAILQALVGFIVREILATQKELAKDLVTLRDDFNKCKEHHAETRATRSDMEKLGTSLSAMHRRIDQIIFLMVKAGLAKMEDVMERPED